MPLPPFPALTLEHLIKDVGPVSAVEGKMKRVVSDVCLEAHYGDITVILGPNGAGKTTTLECAQGIQRRTGGTIRLLGHDPDKADASLRARVGVMLQEGGLPPAARPLPLLHHVASMYATPRPYTEIVETLGIDDYAHTPIRRLSGGQRQRLAVAAALIGRPEIVFLDEPTAGLDPLSRRKVLTLIDQVRNEGVAIVLTTHLLTDAETLADIIYIIDKGRTVTSGTPEQLRSANGGEYHLSFVGPAGAQLETVLRSELDICEEPDGHYQIRGPLLPADLVALATWWQEQDILPQALSLTGQSLEDTFMTIITAARREGQQ